MQLSTIQVFLVLLCHVNFISSRHTVRANKVRLFNDTYETEYDDPDDDFYLSDLSEDDDGEDDDDSYTVNLDVGKYGGLRRNGKVVIQLTAPACLAMNKDLAYIVVGDDNSFTIKPRRFITQFLSFQVINCYGGEAPGLISIKVNGIELCAKPRVTKSYYSAIPAQTSAVSRPGSEAIRTQYRQFDLPGCGQRVPVNSKDSDSGESVRPGEWPWHADIFLEKEIGAPYYRCSGTLVSQDTVITAARCVIENGITTPIEELQVILGKTLLLGRERHTQESRVSGVIIHQKFNTTCLANNIAIIKLKSAVDFNQYIQPACLWSEDDIEKTKIYHQLGTISGWNFHGNKSVSNKLTLAKNPVATDSSCLSAHQQFSKVLDGHSFCAGTLNGVKCNLDTGSGFLLPQLFRNGKGLQEIWYLRGISSTRPVLKKTGGCDPRQLALYTDVAHYATWIESFL